MLLTFRKPLLWVVGSLLVILYMTNMLSTVNAATRPTPFVGVSTVAGGSTFLGDGMAPVYATIGASSMQFASNGEVYIADGVHNSIRKVSLNGKVSTIAGNNYASGDSADGTLASKALLTNPSNLQLTSSGELYFIDGPTRIKKIDKNGYLTCIAGNGTDILPDGFPAKDSTFGTFMFAIHPTTLELYFSDVSNHTIRKISSNGILTHVAGTGEMGSEGDGGLAVNAQFFYPRNLAFNSAGELFVTDSGNNAIRKIDKNGVISTVVGGMQKFGFSGDGGQATEAYIHSPGSFAFNPVNGDFVFHDIFNYRIRKISNKGVITTFAGNGEKGWRGDGGLAINAQIPSAANLYFNQKGELFIVDIDNSIIRNVSLDGTISTYAGGKLGDGLDAATYSQLYLPQGVSITPKGDVLIADARNYRIRQLSNGVLSSVYTKTDLKFPFASILRSNGDIYYADSDEARILKIDAKDGTVSRIVGSGASQGFQDDGVAALDVIIGNLVSFDFNSKGEILFTDQENHRIRKVTTEGIVVTVTGIKAGPNDTIIPAYSGDGGPADKAALSNPYGIVVSPQDEVYIVDKGNFRIRKILTNGTIITVAGTGQSGYSGDGGLAINAKINPRGGIALSPKGDFYFTDNYRIRKVFANGKIATLGGMSYGGFGGDGGLATNSIFDSPLGIAVDSNDNVFIADVMNNRVRKIGLMCASPYAVSGTECVPTCNGIISTDSSNVCSGHGSCNEPNNCTCQTNYNGANCEVFKCKGIASTDSSACSGSGQCIAHDTCKCSGSAFGSNCEFVAVPTKSVVVPKASKSTPSDRLSGGNSLIISYLSIPILTLFCFVF